MEAAKHIQEILLKYWGFSQFRPLQEDIILSVLEGKDTLALMPTGGGKSLCFQVPAMAKEGICIVISPLISLMKDQVDNLRRKNIRALAIVSGMSRREIDIALDNCIHGNVKFLYISPERLTNEIMQYRMEKMNINLIAVDEAHCISQWGYDFRPSYLRIAEIRTLCPEVPVLALTATATMPVRSDIMKQLKFSSPHVFSKSFERKNLSYLVYEEHNKHQRIIKMFKAVKGSGIVYVRNRRKTREIAELLSYQGIKAAGYHAGLTQQERSQRQQDWMRNNIQVMVATNAFGMGIDKPDVRLVVHADMPESLEAYYQEAGRGGRDGKNSFAVLLYQKADRAEMERIFEQTFPEIALIKSIYNALGNYLNVALGSGEGVSFNFDISAFAAAYNFNIVIALNALKILAEAGYLALSDGIFIPARLKFNVGQYDLYNFQVQQPALDKFIKTILRSYGGVFDNYVKINESELARKMEVPLEHVVKNLNYLHKQNILEYIQQTDKGQLTWIIQRLRSEDVVIDVKMLAFRKDRFKERVVAMLNYSESKTTCRNLILLNYFGETASQRCGTCDFCRLRNKIDLNDLEFENIKEKIREKILMAHQTFETILQHETTQLSASTLKTLQWLVDTGVVYENEDGILNWNA